MCAVCRARSVLGFTSWTALFLYSVARFALFPLHPLGLLRCLDNIDFSTHIIRPGAGTMAFLDREASLKSGRSRASSGRSRIGPLNTAPPGGDMFSAAESGVLSMLKTSTDSGDIGDLSFNTSRLPSMPRPAHRRRTNAAHLSASSHHSNNSYTPSQVSKRNSNNQTWDAVSAISQGTHGTQARHGRHGSLTSLQTMQTKVSYVPDTKSPLKRQPNGNTAAFDSRLTAPFSPDGRSYSLTQPQPSFGLKPHRSATSLRSQGSGPLPSQRNPYVYPARLRRPGYRAPSPALGDLDGPLNPSMFNQGQVVGDTIYNPGYDRPSYNQAYLSHRSRNGALQRGNDGQFPPPQVTQYSRPIGRPPMPSYNSDYAPGVHPVQRYPGNFSHAQRQPISNLAPYPADTSQYYPRPGQMRSSPGFPNPSYGGQYLPPRMYTPHADSIPSSDQGSSAPPSSNPPTPKDLENVHVAVKSLSIDPAPKDLSDEQTEPHGFPNYLKYAENAGKVYELDASEPAAAELAAEPTPGRGGFVQRIKDLLEKDTKLLDPIPSMPQQLRPAGHASPICESKTRDQTRRAPVELPISRKSTNSPVELPAAWIVMNDYAGPLAQPVELEAPTRLTRELIKANTAPSSSNQQTATSQPSQPDEDVSRASRQAIFANSRLSANDSYENDETVGSSPPYLEIDSTSGDTTSALREVRDINTSGTDYAVQIEVPLHADDEVASNVRPSSSFEVDQLSLDRDRSSGPVSPIRPGEEAGRNSLVSPMVTQTLHLQADHDPQVPGSFPEESAEPPSPVSRPMSGCLSAEVSSNRFSLPPDLSLLNEQDVTSDVVTDVAVRLSVPRTAEHGKPQLVSVSSALDIVPIQPRDLVQRQVDARSLRESFFNVEKIAPLQIKKPDVLPITAPTADSTDLSSFIRRSFPRRQSIWPGDHTESKRLSTTSQEPGLEPRFPGMKMIPGHLPGLKEESQEDMSIKDYRSSYSGLRLAHPPALRTNPPQEYVRRPDDNTRASYLPSRAPRMTLSELRNIPSLNFSRLDLVDKLNEALVSHPSKSLEIARTDIHCPSPLRPSSTDSLRERYTSFFAKPEEFLIPEPVYGDTTEEGLTTERPQDTEATQADSSDILAHYEGDAPSQQEETVVPPEIMTTSPSLRTRSSSMRPLSRPMSPEELFSLTQDANRLSIPSVAALSERLSHLLPSIRHLMFDSTISDDNAVKETLDKIHHLGQRPDSDGLLRSSTGLRQMAAMADDIVANGTHDSAVFDVKMARLLKELPPLPEDTEKFSLSDSGLDRNTTTLGSETVSSVAVAEPEMPKPLLMRVKSLNDIEEVDQMHPGYPGSATKKSFVPSTHHSRPWNMDEYYPWTSNSVKIDIDFPRPMPRRNTSASTVLRRSKVSSEGSSDTYDAGDNTRATRARSPLSNQPPILLETSPTIDSTITSRKASKRSLIGSLTRKIGLSGHKVKSPMHVSLVPELSTKPGDRYPSTALIPPLALNMDEVRSFFSDSTSNGSEKRGSFRKHINIFRSRMPGGPVALSASRLCSLDAERIRSETTARSISLYDDRFTEPETQQTYEGMVGMGKVEFRVKRVTERLRIVLLKTGHMLRTLSHKRDPSGRRLQKERERAEWLDDSLYSGT